MADVGCCHLVHHRYAIYIAQQLYKVCFMELIRLCVLLIKGLNLCLLIWVISISGLSRYCASYMIVFLSVHYVELYLFAFHQMLFQVNCRNPDTSSLIEKSLFFLAFDSDDLTWFSLYVAIHFTLYGNHPQY